MKKFLIGCGITVLVLAALGFGVSFYFFNKLKQELAVTDQVEARRSELRDQFGEPSAFTPATVFDAVRFGSFLEIREAVHGETVPRLADAESQLADARDQGEGGLLGKVRGFSSMMRGGVGALKVAFSGVAVRDSLLLEAGMPEGEYIYYHCLAVHSWLDWTPPEHGGESPLLDEHDWQQAVRESRDELRAVYLDILGNLAQALGEREDLTPEEQALVPVLDEQLERRWGRTEDWPLQDALPEGLVAELEPFEARLRGTLPRSTVEFFVDAMATFMTEDEGGGSVRVRFDR